MEDKKRGKVFTKIIREITVAARLGGGDVGDNPRLRAVVDKALAVNMPRDTIDRAIQRGAGGADPIGQRRALQIDPIALEDLGLSVKWKVVGVFTDQHMG